MGPLVFQNVYLWRKTQQLWFLLLVSITWALALDETGDKTFNVKIGFDLTHGAHGASSLRIRNFEGNDQLANDDGEMRSHPALRVGSASSSDENENKKHRDDSIAVEMKAAEESDPSDDDDSDGSDNERKQRSTKGLRADEYEPESNPLANEKVDKGSESESST